MGTRGPVSYLQATCNSHGLSLEDILLLDRLYAKPEYAALSDTDFSEVAAAFVNSHRAGSLALPAVTPERLVTAIDFLRVGAPPLFNREAERAALQEADAYFADAKLAASAQPALQFCLRCEGKLQLAGNTSAWFYAPNREGVQGRLYHKACEQCGGVYELDGYSFPEDPAPSGCSTPPKHPYLQHQGGHWDRVTNDTVIDVQVYRQFEGEFLHLHAKAAQSTCGAGPCWPRST